MDRELSVCFIEHTPRDRQRVVTCADHGAADDLVAGVLLLVLALMLTSVVLTYFITRYGEYVRTMSRAERAATEIRVVVDSAKQRMDLARR